MKSAPLIIVQLVHIKGPMKGDIQEFAEPEITFGRHPSSHIQFSKDQTLISRKHARIVRDGNRFKIMDCSTNGTFLNGRKVTEAYLKDGDVLMFTEGGPKVSFLTRTDQAGSPHKPRSLSGSRPSTEDLPVKKDQDLPPPLPALDDIQQPPLAEKAVPAELDSPALIQPAAVPLAIQFGPTLQAFKRLPVTIGKRSDCDCTLDHPAVFDRHAQIFFSQDQYWIKDITGQSAVFINQKPIRLQAPFKPDDILTLGDNGPCFRFLGAGRLAEIEAPSPPPASDSRLPAKGRREESSRLPKRKRSQGSFLKKIFS